MLTDDDLDALFADTAPALSAEADARVVQAVERLAAPAAARASREASGELSWSVGPLPWIWLTLGLVALAFAVVGDLQPRATQVVAPREPWRCPPNPRPALELPQEHYRQGGQRLLFN